MSSVRSSSFSLETSYDSTDLRAVGTSKIHGVCALQNELCAKILAACSQQQARLMEINGRLAETCGGQLPMNPPLLEELMEITEHRAEIYDAQLRMNPSENSYQQARLMEINGRLAEIYDARLRTNPSETSELQERLMEITELRAEIYDAQLRQQ